MILPTPDHGETHPLDIEEGCDLASTCRIGTCACGTRVIQPWDGQKRAFICHECKGVDRECVAAWNPRGPYVATPPLLDDHGGCAEDDGVRGGQGRDDHEPRYSGAAIVWVLAAAFGWLAIYAIWQGIKAVGQAKGWW